MPRKTTITGPISFTVPEPARGLEAALRWAEMIKNKETPIQHNKAAKAMEAIIEAADNFEVWLDKNIDNPGFEAVREAAIQLMEEKLGVGSELGEWLNQDRNSRHQYQDLLINVLDIEAPKPTVESRMSEMLPRRLAKATVRKTQEFKQDYEKELAETRSNSSGSLDASVDGSESKKSPSSP